MTKPAATDRTTILPNVIYGQRHGVPLSFDLYRPARGNGSAVLFINSGGFVSGQLVQYAPNGQSAWRLLAPHELTVPGAEPPIPLLSQFSFAGLLARGFTVFDVRHSNHPPSTLDHMVEDVHAAARFITKRAPAYGIAADRMGVWGPSAGGYLALQLGFSFEGGPFAAVATYYPAGYDFLDAIVRFPEIAAALPALRIERDVLDALSLKHLLRLDGPPVLVVYGTDDMPIITETCEALCRRLAASSGAVRCVAIPGTGHEFRGADGYHPQHGHRAQDELIDWFERHLAAR